MAKIKYLPLLLLLAALSACTKWNYIDGGLSYGVHDCSMWDYLKKQPADWDSTRIMIEHAGLKDLFEGKGEYGQITFLGVTNRTIEIYLLQHGLKRVTDLSPEFCRELLSKLIIPQRLMLGDVPRGERIASSGQEVNGLRTETLGGGIFLWTHQQPYMEIEEAGEVALYFRIDGSSENLRVYSTDIQTENGVVQALGYDFTFETLIN